MDPFTALGLAGNICQFIDFSYKLVTGATDIYHSTSGAASAVTDAEQTTRALRDLASRLAIQSTSVYDGNSPTVQGKTDLNELALNCRDVADELLSALARLHASSPNRAWSSIKVGIATMMKKEKLDQLEARLEKYRRQIILTLEAMQSEQQSTIMWKINTLYETNSRLHADMTYQIGHLRQSVLEAIEQIRSELSRQDMQTILGRMKADSDAFLQSTRRKPVDVTPHVSSLSQAATIGSAISTSLDLLRTLRFNSMEFRYSKITSAHLKTFQWMFHNTFNQWLQSNHSIFWISGKPGSGKSTLMKLLVNNNAVSDYLSRARDGSKVVIASYFFWINGTEIQKSQEGLLRSLLYDLLRKTPELIQLTFPEHWQMLENGYEEEDLPSWTREALLNGISRLLHATTSTRFCIFIDGLDEYEGDHEDLIRIVQDCARSNVKLCIASRPWNVFESAFGHDQMHKLYLEQFNRQDITIYVKDKLESRPDFQALRARDSTADQLVSEVIHRAQGVFLWVYLVVRSLVRGIQNSDRISDLQRRLRAFPSDLDDFFNHILTSLDETYRVQVARVFQVALAAPRPLSLLNYWYIDVEESDPAYFSRLPIQSLDSSELRAREDEMTRRLNGRFKGLLEVTILPNHMAPYKHRVDFLHRTVKDFLRTKNQHEQQTGFTLGNVLQELNKTITKFTVDFPTQQPYYPWANWGSDDMLTHAIRWSLLIYVQSRLQYQVLSTSEKTLFLLAALKGRFGRNGEVTLGPDAAMVDLILQHQPPVTLDDRALAPVVSSWRHCNLQSLVIYGSLMSLVTHRVMRLKPDSEVFTILKESLSADEVLLLERTQQDTKRNSRNPFRRWWRSRGK
ncbi:hypothetical protein PT974_07753 [Cladobotryum mycophilum]|uniref:NACHT domain-containing protein n=1 Tax=Cladobotryum mycophilum TaxID=491253 RepID=A0ABR0SHV4_9HYPO